MIPSESAVRWKKNAIIPTFDLSYIISVACKVKKIINCNNNHYYFKTCKKLIISLT